jgi:excisionase family DNA binding protein
MGWIYAYMTDSSSVTTSNKLTYSLDETADALGLSYVTVRRLLKRGLIRACSVSRKRIIPKTEIQRFLRETLQ